MVPKILGLGFLSLEQLSEFETVMQRIMKAIREGIFHWSNAPRIFIDIAVRCNILIAKVLRSKRASASSSPGSFSPKLTGQLGGK